MGVTRTRYLSEFEIHVLLAVAQQGADAYGVSILREIERRSGRRVWIGPLYTSLAKLERLRLLRGRASEPLAIRGGRSRRLYSLTAAGTSSLYDSLAMLDRMRDGVRLRPVGSLPK